MAGHSKWANTKHRKAVQDNKKGKIFSKIIREVMISTRLGGSDVSTNPKLRATIDKALSNNMTRNTVNKAILRAMGNKNNDNAKMNIYEGYGPGGTAIIIKCISNNYNRTVSCIRHIFTKNGGNLASNGSVAYLFYEFGVITYVSKTNKNELIETALNLNIEDLESYGDDKIELYTTLKNFIDVKNKLIEYGFNPKDSKIIMMPITKIKLIPEVLPKFLSLIKELKTFIDVCELYHNGEL